MKIQANTFPTQITNLIVMTPNENDLEELPEKEFKRMLISAFKQLKEDINKHQENKDTNAIRKLI